MCARALEVALAFGSAVEEKTMTEDRITPFADYSDEDLVRLLFELKRRNDERSLHVIAEVRGKFERRGLLR